MGINGGDAELWAIILAGGEGVRLRAVTETLTGLPRPKQFCSLLGEGTLLDDTLRRATLSVPPDQQVVVVNQHHYAYWAALLDSTLAGRRLAVQPDNRGTAPALLLAVQAVASLAGNVPVVILPSDHHVSDDRLFMAHVESAAHLTAIQPDSPVLLGIEATSAETEYGWIEPARLACTRHASTHPVRRFWEKPDRATAQVLLERGCLWNSMVMVGTTSGFCRLIQSALPDLTAVMEPLRVLPPDHTRLERIYADLPVLGFSERVLMARPEQCLVTQVLGVGWTDLGNPARVFDIMKLHGRPMPIPGFAPEPANVAMLS